MSKNNNLRAGGMYNEWKNYGFNRNPVNQQEQSIEFMYIRLLTDLAASRFKWEGLPDEIDVRFLELTLFYQAMSIFYHDGRYDTYMAMRGTQNGSLDYQNNPTGFNPIGNNFVTVPVSGMRDTEFFDTKTNQKVKIGQGIPIWANKQRIPDVDIVMIYAKKLANLDRTVEINSLNARRNKVIVTNDAMNLTMTNIARQIEEGQNNLKIKGNVDIDSIKAIDLGIDPLTILNLDIVRDRQWNKCMTLLGIESANQDKKERLVSDEVTANGDQTSMMRYVNLNERRVAAKKINDKYGLDISVSYYTDEERKANMAPTTETPKLSNESGDENE